MIAIAKEDYHNELTKGAEYNVVAVLEYEGAVGGTIVVIADNDNKDFGTYSVEIFFSDIIVKTK